MLIIKPFLGAIFAAEVALAAASSQAGAASRATGNVNQWRKSDGFVVTKLVKNSFQAKT